MRNELMAGVAVVSMVVSSYGQGTVNFDNRGGNGGAGAPVYDVDGVTPLGFNGPPGNGGNFFAQLYAAAGTGVASSSLSAVGVPVNFTDWNLAFPNGAGLVDYFSYNPNTLGQAVDPAVTVPTAVAGGAATVQMRAWWGGGNVYSTFEAAAAALGSDPTHGIGFSSVLNLGVTGSGGGSPPVDLTGLQSFALFVPEPSTFALAGLGALSLLLFRRRK